MTKPKLPQGASRIWDMRVAGVKPNEPVFISTVGPLRDGNFQVYLSEVGRFEQYDWRWIIDLCVCLVYDSHVDPKKLSQFARRLVRNAPNGGYMTPFDPSFGYLWLWNSEKQNGSLLSYWKGHDGWPLMQIPGEPESLKVEPMMRIDRAVFEGVMPA